MWVWQGVGAALALAACAALRAFGRAASDTLAWSFPRSALRDFPVTRRVDGREVEGFIVGHREAMALFSESPGGDGEAVEPDTLRPTGELEYPERYSARASLWERFGAVLVGLVVVLLAAAVLGADVDLFRTPPRLAPNIGDPVEVRVSGVLFSVWHDGEVVHGEPGGRWRVRTHTWSDHDEEVVVPGDAIKRRYGDLWGDVSAWRLPHFTTAIFAALAALFAAAAYLLEGLDPKARRVYLQLRARAAPPPPPSSPRPNVNLQVATISLGFDATVRRVLQDELQKVAKAAEVTSSGGLALALRDTLSVLDRQAAGLRAVHGAFESCGSPDDARVAFEARVTTERGRYVVESLRVDAGGERAVAVKAKARSEEGGGFVVVSLVVVWAGTPGVFLPVASREDLARVTRGMAADAPPIKALEVVWVPAEPEDVMSSAEMATVFSRLAWVDADARARFGRAVCASCKAAYARELGECPNCGAVSPRGDDPAAP
jgi:hypothetical protein